MGRTQARLTLASSSPQRRAILQQLRIPFDVVVPLYVEHDPPGADPASLVCEHARGKARSVHRGGWTLGVDTTVQLGGRVYGKPAGEAAARAMVRDLSGRRHTVLSGLCLLGPGTEEIAHAETSVSFRELSDLDVALYVSSREWEGRAGGYAIQGLGGRLVESIEGDYLNVVGLPGALLVTLLGEHVPELLEIPR